MQKEGAADNPMLLSGLSKHWNLNQAFDVENYPEDEKLEWFWTDICRQVLLPFLQFDSRRAESQGAWPVEGSIVWLARLYELAATLVHCCAKSKSRGRHRHKLGANTYGAMYSLAKDQLTRNISPFLRYWELDDMVGKSAGEATKLIQIPKSGLKYLSVDSGWFKRYITTEPKEYLTCPKKLLRMTPLYGN